MEPSDEFDGYVHVFPDFFRVRHADGLDSFFEAICYLQACLFISLVSISFTIVSFLRFVPSKIQ